MAPKISSSFKGFVKRSLIQSLQWLGHDFDPASLEGALGRCRNRGMEIRTVIDVGASDGRWTRVCRQYFPQADYFLIEAQQPHEDALRLLKKETPGLDYRICAAGDQEGIIYFDASDLFGGIASHTPFEENCIEVPVTTIDHQVKEQNLRPPFLIKLDTHGFEVPILEGARDTLEKTALIVIETYNFNHSRENLRFAEMTQQMEMQGFRCVDLCDPLHRPLDQALWQFDLFFEPVSSPVFKTNQYDGIR